METNSEKTLLKVMGVAGLVIVALGAAVQALMEGGITEQWPWFATVGTVFALLVPLAKSYIDKRPAKNEAVAARVLAEAKLLEVKGSLASPPQSPPQS